MRGLVLTTVALTFGAVVPAHAAAPSVVTAAALRYFPADQRIAQGSSLTFVNLERAPHDVTALDLDSGGWPLFKSDVVYDVGGRAQVHGVEALEPGIYQFYCSVHEEMTGTVQVA